MKTNVKMWFGLDERRRSAGAQQWVDNVSRFYRRRHKPLSLSML